MLAHLMAKLHKNLRFSMPKLQKSYNMIDLCRFLVKAAQKERKSSKFATENVYPDAGNVR